VYYPQVLNQTNFMGLSQQDLTYLAFLNVPGGQMGGSMDQLDDAGTYFDLGVRQITTNGIFHYMCTRNDNFSNRNQKGKIVVSNSAATVNVVDANGGQTTASGATLDVKPGALNTLTVVNVVSTPFRDSSGVSVSGSSISNVVTVSFDASALAAGQSVTVYIPISMSALHTYSTSYSSTGAAGTWSSFGGSVSYGSNLATIQTTQPGDYAVGATLNGGAVAGIVIGIVVFFVLVAVAVFFIKKHKAGGATVTTTAQMANKA